MHGVQAAQGCSHAAPPNTAPASPLSKPKLVRALQVQVCRWSIIIDEYDHTHWGAHR